jgi:ornithine carbamoyltransferase
LRNLLSINDIPRKRIEDLFRLTDYLKENPLQPWLENKTLAMVFAKPSTRTRVSFEVAMEQLGGHAIFLGMNDIQLGRGEAVSDTAKALSRYVDGIMARLFKHSDLKELAKHSDVPVINGLTDLLHPCQALADVYTIDEKLERLKGVKVSYVGDGSSNACHSLIHACSKLGLDLTIGCPKKYAPDKGVLSNGKRNAGFSGARIRLGEDPKKAVKGAEVLYTDTWVSMGEDKEKAARLKALKPYQVNRKLMALADPLCLFMHDLPAYRGNEVTADIIDGKRSIVWDQAENRLHVQKAILAMLMGPKLVAEK